MSQTVRSEFRVLDIIPTDIVLKNVETGLTVFVERQESIYDSAIWEDIESLRVNQIREFELESQNPENTIWKIIDIS